MKSLAFFPVTLISVAVAFTFRVLAVREHWLSIMPLDAPPRARPLRRETCPPSAGSRAGERLLLRDTVGLQVT
jgi:hypothetical protein